jgi:hypothetical protein
MSTLHAKYCCTAIACADCMRLHTQLHAVSTNAQMHAAVGGIKYIAKHTKHTLHGRQPSNGSNSRHAAADAHGRRSAVPQQGKYLLCTPQ